MRHLSSDTFSSELAPHKTMQTVAFSLSATSYGERGNNLGSLGQRPFCQHIEFRSKMFASCWSTTRMSYPALFLNAPNHFLAQDSVMRTAHHCQHLERGQRVECPVILAKVKSWHNEFESPDSAAEAMA
jgi:hypothetical protein